MDMYQENILDHYQNPRNFGELEQRTLRIRDTNPLCGDMLEVDLLIEEGVIKDIRFHGHGCAISLASMSMLSEELKGKTIDSIKDIDKEHILKLLGIDVTMARMKCALLSLKVVKMGWVEYNKDKN